MGRVFISSSIAVKATTVLHIAIFFISVPLSRLIHCMRILLVEAVVVLSDLPAN